jgi:iron(III) transport system substrate-binding protein
VAGVGIVDSGDNQEAAQAFVDYLLSQSAQEYFNRETNEYPLSGTVETNPLLTPLSDIDLPALDLNQLEDLEGTLQLLTELGIL